MIRVAESDADLAAYVEVWNAVPPNRPTTVEAQRERRERDPRRLNVVALRDDAVVGCGFAGPSQSEGRVAVAPRVLPAARRAGIGSSLLKMLIEHAGKTGCSHVSASVAGDDDGSLAFARRFGFEEVDREVEQVRSIGDEKPPAIPAGVRFVTIAEQPQLLRDAYDLALEGYADLATPTPVTISLEEWLGEEATLPAGSFVAFAGNEIVGYSGLCRRFDGVVEDGLTVVRRDWRRRGLAIALKQAELHWAAANGIQEVVTWTQRGNDGMRAVNERLGYLYRSVEITVNAPLLDGGGS